MWQRFPPRMRKAITGALDEAARRGSDEATTEDLLVAVARDPECAAVFMLEHAGITPARVLQRLDVPTNPPPNGRASKFSPATLEILNAAAIEADRLRHPHVGTEHIALSLAARTGSAANQALRDLGFTHERADAALRQWIRLGMPRRRSELERATPMSPAVRWALHLLKSVTRYPRAAWQVYVHKSLGHPGFVKNPYPLYRKLREKQPVRRDPLAPVWVVTSYADTFNMLRDTRFRKDPFAPERLPRPAREQFGISESAAARASFEQTSMLFLDPPAHTRVRSLFTKAFTPRRLESLKPRIQAITDRLLDDVKGRSEFDLMADLAAPLPVIIIAELLGFPAGDHRQIKLWSDDMTEALGFNPSAEQQARANKARDEIQEYFSKLVERYRREPADNLLSALVSLESTGEALNPDEMFSNSILLLAAGHETTTNLIGNGVLALLNHPEQLRDLRAHTDDLIESTVEELLRYDPPVQWTSRVAGEDMEFGGQKLSNGDIVVASVGAANRDPSVFKDPDRLDIRRADNKHLSFGTGVHFCLGATLARWEAQIVIATLLKRMPNLRLAQQKLRWRRGITFRGVHSLRLTT